MFSGATKALRRWASNFMAFLGSGPRFPDSLPETADPYEAVPSDYVREYEEQLPPEFEALRKSRATRMAEAKEQVDALWPTLMMSFPTFVREILTDPLVVHSGDTLEIRTQVRYPEPAMAALLSASVDRIRVFDGDREIPIDEPVLINRNGKVALHIPVNGRVPTHLSLLVCRPIGDIAEPFRSEPLKVWSQEGVIRVYPLTAEA